MTTAQTAVVVALTLVLAVLGAVMTYAALAAYRSGERPILVWLYGIPAAAAAVVTAALTVTAIFTLVL